MVHELKIKSKYFKSVVDGDKTFEVRFNDRDYKEGDILILKEFDGEQYTGRVCHKFVKYILDYFPEGLRMGYVVLGIGDYDVQN